MANRPKKRYSRQKSDDEPYVLSKPVLRNIRNYLIRRQQQVLLFLVHHRIPSKRNIYGEYVNVAGRRLLGIDPVEKKGYKRPTTEEARAYFKIKNRFTISTWWNQKEMIFGGSMPKAHSPRWPGLKTKLVKQFTAARNNGKIITVHWFR
jgi:hypothetical protein